MRSAETRRLLGSSFLVAGCPPLLRGVLCSVQAPRLSMCSSPRGATGGGGPQPAAALTMQANRVQVVVTSDVRPAAFARFEFTCCGRNMVGQQALRPAALSIRQDSRRYSSLFMCDASALLVSHPLGHHDHIRFGMCQWSFGNFMRHAVCRSVCSVSTERHWPQGSLGLHSSLELLIPSVLTTATTALFTPKACHHCCCSCCAGPAAAAAASENLLGLPVMGQGTPHLAHCGTHHRHSVPCWDSRRNFQTTEC